MPDLEPELEPEQGWRLSPGSRQVELHVVAEAEAEAEAAVEEVEEVVAASLSYQVNRHG